MVRIADEDPNPRYISDAVIRLENESQARLLVSFDEDQDPVATPYSFSLATSQRPHHLLGVSPIFKPYLSHLVLSTALKGQRIYDEKPQQRLQAVPANESSAPREVVEMLTRSCPSLPEHEVQSQASDLYRDTVAALAGLPVDLRIESDIFHRYEQHRQLQADYLVRMIQLGGDRILEEPTPKIINPFRDVRQALARAYLMGISQFADLPGKVRVRNIPLNRKAALLLEMVNSESLSGHSGDRKLVNRWAIELGIQDWYRWDTMDEH